MYAESHHLSAPIFSNLLPSLVEVYFLLQDRTKQAQAVSSVYKIACDYLSNSTMPHDSPSSSSPSSTTSLKPSQIFQVPTILFLQQFFTHQDSFPKHYADGLEGCGLQLEAAVRTGFYEFVRRLNSSVTGFRKALQTPNAVLHQSLTSAYICVLAYFLHFLDIRWQVGYRHLILLPLASCFISTSFVMFHYFRKAELVCHAH